MGMTPAHFDCIAFLATAVPQGGCRSPMCFPSGWAFAHWLEKPADWLIVNRLGSPMGQHRNC